ncbi:hypothetical protein Acr_16g0001200 [Actinidia rufa]|uniref:RNase H type-1 domain-containing protein n=1 Tax=Actinidia rufa TaxID=165716 RepID=A0A7J0FXV2_9ERIC|nr:hypothetical protein Acr_16g0001200 [Actinidia rufa]
MNENNARLIQHLTTNNPLPPPAAPVPEVEQSHRSQRSGDDKSQGHYSTGRARNRGRQSPSLRPSKADKYIVAEELFEAKRRRQGKDNHKRKKTDTRQYNYRDEVKNKRFDRNSRTTNDRRPRTPPCRLELVLPPLNTPIAQLKEWIADLIKKGYLRKYISDRPQHNSLERRYEDNRPTTRDIQIIHGGFGLEEYSSASRKRHAKSASRQAEKEVYNFSSLTAEVHQPITFTNDDLRGLHLPHDDALVISTTIANFNGEYNTPARVDQVASYLGNRTLPDHCLVGFHCGRLSFALQCNPMLPNIERDKGYHFYLLLENEVSHVNRDRRGKGDQKVVRACFILAMKTESSPKATTNIAEYEALLTRLRVVAKLGVESLDAFSDSQLIINQVQGEYLTKDHRMMAYLNKVKNVSMKIKDFKIFQIPREENRKADALANLASAFDFISNRYIPLEFLRNSSIQVAQSVYQTEASLTWIEDFTAYLRDRTLPNDKL